MVKRTQSGSAGTS